MNPGIIIEDEKKSVGDSAGIPPVISLRLRQTFSIYRICCADYFDYEKVNSCTLFSREILEILHKAFYRKIIYY